MAMEITNNFGSVYENTYTAQQQQTARKEETKGTTATQKSSGTGSNNSDYLNKLAKLAPSVEFRVGNSFSSAKTGKTLTINPKLLEKMQSDPKLEKETKELIKGVESATKLMDGIYKASGWAVVYRHGYIDENGKYRSVALVRNEAGYKMSEKLRKERRENAEKLIEKTKEKAEKKKEKLQEALEEKRTKKEDKKTRKAEKLIEEKLASSKNGIIYMYDTDIRELMEAMKEDGTDKEKTGIKKHSAVGGNLDVQV